MDDDVIRMNYAKQLRIDCLSYVSFGASYAISTGAFLAVRFCIVHYAMEENEFRCQDVLQIINFLIAGSSGVLLAVAAGLPLTAVYHLLLSRFGNIVSSLSIVIAVHHQTAVLFTLVFVVDRAISLIHGLWCAGLIGFVVVAELVIEHRGDSSMIEHKRGRVYKFTLCHAFFEIAVLIGLAFFGERILYTHSGLRAPDGSDPSPHFTVIFNVFALMTLFAWLNARAACMGYSKKLLISPILWTSLSACAVMQVLCIQFGGSHLWVHPLTLWQWAVSIAVAALVLVWGPIVNCILLNPITSTAASIPYQAVVKE